MTVKIEELTISAFRGIPNRETFSPVGENFLVMGPNGSGKSTVLQAIEFLFTGEISALKGSGTGRVYETRHVPNRQADPADTYVEAILSTSTGDQFRVRREFTNRNHLDAERRPLEFRSFLQTTRNGGLQLTRSQLLSLVITTPGTRKDRLQQLLNIEGVDERRKQLKRLRRRARKERDIRKDRRERALENLVDVIGVSVKTMGSDNGPLLDAINDRRLELGGDPIESLDSVESFSAGVSPPIEQIDSPLQRAEVTRALNSISEWFDDRLNQTIETVGKLQQAVTALRADKEALTDLTELALVRDGMTIIDESTTECPLCKTEWEQGELHERLRARERRLSRVENRTSEIRSLTTSIQQILDPIQADVETLVRALATEDTGANISSLKRYQNDLSTVLDTIEADATDVLEDEAIDTIDEKLRDDDVQTTISQLQSKADSLPGKTVLQNHWDTLQTVTTAYREYQSAEAERESFDNAHQELDIAHEQFLAARDDVLGTLYNSISNRFHELYATINPDERAHDARLEATNTGIELSIDFFDGEVAPPNALHSEGHQDVMGLCLFLAVAERLSGTGQTPLLLDDVVMSIDSEHQRRIAELFATELDDFQLFLSSHDEDWTSQLSSSGVVREPNILHFADWLLTSGPIID